MRIDVLGGGGDWVKWQEAATLWYQHSSDDPCA
jgi:hypothetical protein